MTSTRWIAVASLLVASPVFAQTSDLSLPPLPPNATDVASTPESAVSFDDEVERLRREIATTKTLREQIASEANRPLETETLATQKQRHELLELLTKLATKRTAPPPPTPASPLPLPTSKVGAQKSEAKPGSATTHPLITDKIVDPYALGRALFRAGDYIGAEQAFRKVNVTDDNRVLLQYLIATCLRKQSHWEQAVKAYRVVADNKDDPALRDLALWQLENIRWHQQTESQLEQLRELSGSSDTSEAPSPTTKSTSSSR